MLAFTLNKPSLQFDRDTSGPNARTARSGQLMVRLAFPEASGKVLFACR
ncbi:MAG: hypothetical protein GF350_11615 [Chitinivibrionales bacterium]|nr:hypothetical protein [Chitinivibrionales bacterium]